MEAAEESPMQQQVRTLKHVLTQDVDITKEVDVKVIDAHVFSCLIAAQKALDKQPLPGFPARESGHIWSLIGCLAHPHRSIRRLLIGERSAAAVDALAIARLQVESLYILCYLLQSPENIRLFMKNGWSRQTSSHNYRQTRRSVGAFT